MDEASCIGGSPSNHRSRRFGELFLSRVVAVLVLAQELTTVALADLLDEERRAALRTLLCHGTDPEHEVAVGVVRAAKEHLAALRLALDDLAALVCVLGTLDTRCLVLDVLARRI